MGLAMERLIIPAEPSSFSLMLAGMMTLASWWGFRWILARRATRHDLGQLHDVISTGHHTAESDRQAA